MIRPAPRNGDVDTLVDVAGQPLHVRRQAGTGPTVVLCGGLGLVCSDWNAVLRRLPGVDVVVYDRPGTGHSPPPRPPWPSGAPATLDEEVHRIAGVVAAVGAAPPYVLVGHSSGGLFVQAFARLHPQLTAGLVLVDASAAQPPPSPVAAAGWHGVRTTLARTGLPHRIGPLGRRLVVWSQTLSGHDPLDPAERKRIYGTREGVRGVLAELAGFDAAAARLGELAATAPLPAVPIGMVTAASTGRPLRRRDRSWLAEQRRLADALDVDSQRVVDQAAHLVQLDRPDAVAEEISRIRLAEQDDRGGQ